MKSDRPNFYRHHFAAVLILVSSLCVLCGKTSAQNFKAVHPGVEYAVVHHKLGSDPVKINLLRLDLEKVRLDVHHALDKAIGVEPTSAIAIRHGAVAAINAGFFRLDKSEFAGDASGALVIDGELLSESSLDRIALVLGSADSTLFAAFDHVKVFPRFYHHSLTVPELNGINRERKRGEAIIYSPQFGQTTPRGSGSTALILESCERGRCRRFAVSEGNGNTTIPRNGYVIVLNPLENVTHKDFIANLRRLTVAAKRDRIFEVAPAVLSTEWYARLGKGIYIVAGVPQLIKNGKIHITWEQEKAARSFVEMRHPRTAVAKLKDGKFLMITVDGRQPGGSVGMNLYELADYLLSLGAIDAMNLDGGGSTTMFLDGRVVNTPSDREGERKVGDAILVTLRKNARR